MVSICEVAPHAKPCECRDLKERSSELVLWKDAMNLKGEWDPSPNQQDR